MIRFIINKQARLFSVGYNAEVVRIAILEMIKKGPADGFNYIPWCNNWRWGGILKKAPPTYSICFV